MTKTVLLGDITTKIGSGATPRGGANSYLNTGPFALIRSQNIRDEGFSYNGLVYISEEQADKLKNVEVRPNDVLINITGDSVARVGRVPNGILPARVNQHVAILRPNLKKVDPNYLYYSLIERRMNQRLLTMASTGATRNALTKVQLEKLKLDITEITEQKKIADILGAIDEKIELNRKMNGTLEQMGRALFRHHFIDSPKAKEWHISTIGMHYDVLLGGTPSRSKREYWENGTIGWINSGKINEFRITEPSELITEEALRKSAAKLLPIGTTVIAITGATLGQISRVEREFAANQSVIGIVPRGRMGHDFIYYWINHKIANLIGHQTGGAQQHINRSNVVNFEMPTPDDITLKEFCEKIEPISSQISNNCFEIQSLNALRDMLLPRLISGKIKVV